MTFALAALLALSLFLTVLTAALTCRHLDRKDHQT